MSDVGTLLAGIGAMLSALFTGVALWRTTGRGSDRESEKAVTVGLEVAKDETVTSITPVERERGGQ